MQDARITFKNDAEARLAAAQFQEIKKHPAWTRIHKFMEEKIKFIDYELREGKISSIDELERLRDRRNIAEQFMNLPDLITEFIKNSGGVDIEFDPYKGTVPSVENKELDPYVDTKND